MALFVLPQPRAFSVANDAPVFRLTELCNLRATSEAADAEEDLCAFLAIATLTDD